MTIQLNKEVKVTEQIEVATPCFRLYQGIYLKLNNDETIIHVSKPNLLTTYYKEHLYYQNELNTFLNKGEEISEEEFNDAFAETVDHVSSLAGFYNIPTLELQ